MTLFDEDDKELAASARPAMLPHTSGSLKGLQMLFLWPLHLTGLLSESDMVTVPFIDCYEASAVRQVHDALLGRNAACKS